jgi:SAM-dependent methyltransferase
MLDPTKRFSNRVENYLKFRPRYPTEITALLEKDCALTPDSVIADIGSGTGFLSELFLRKGNRVLGIEPNAEMRAAGERLLADYPNFVSIDARAEATTLPEGSVDFVTVGQAFHWFDLGKARVEFSRILKPNGVVVLVWNGFQTSTSPATAAFLQIVVRYSVDYHEAVREVLDDEISLFFSPGECRKRQLQNEQSFDFEGLKGRVLSMSYAPDNKSSDYTPMLAELQQFFNEYQRQNRIVIEYETPVYCGTLVKATS